ncbi:MAG: phage portal protein, partial [Verrucomicrobiota bacterium]
MPILTISKAPGANPADGPSWADRIRGAFRSSSGRNEGDIFTGPAESHGGLRDAAYATGERPKSDRALLSSDGKTENMEREELMKESRRLFENVAAVKVAEKAHSRFCSPVMWYAGTGDDEDDLVLTRYIARQMEADRFDIARAHDLPTSVASAIIDWGVDGDIFANMVTPRNSDRFRVQWVRAHRVGKSDKTIDVSEEITAAFRQRAPQRFREIGGIVVDSLDERRAIRVYPANRNMMAGVTEKPKTIPWSQVLHLVDPLKTDRLREVTRWNSAIPEIVDLEQTWRFLKATIKQQVAAPIVETSKDGRPKPSQRRPSLDSSSSEPSDEKPPLREMVPGQFQYLRDGEKIADFTMQRPNATFFECVEYLLRNGSWAIDMPYPFIYEPKGMNGGTLRLENSKAGASVGYSRGKVTKCLLDPWVRAKIPSPPTNLANSSSTVDLLTTAAIGPSSPGAGPPNGLKPVSNKTTDAAAINHAKASRDERLCCWLARSTTGAVPVSISCG